ncbi:MAG: hypothetical protein AB2810_17890, partial [Candidatus Thiodiazotropha endolucinida]
MEKQTSYKAVISDKAYPVPIEMRPLWRICLIIISIAVVSGEKKYLDSKKVNILVWMLIRKRRWDEYENYLLGRTNGIPLVSVDTATYKAVEFSIAKGFVLLKDGRVKIKDSGQVLHEILVKNESMQDEMYFLKKKKKK